MGQILHGSATPAPGLNRGPRTQSERFLQRSQATAKELATRYGLNPRTVAKWKKCGFVHDAAMGPKQPRSTVLTPEEEAMAVAFRRHTLLPLDDCLYALQATVPHLTRSSVHRLFQRHGISRLPEVEGNKRVKKKFKSYPIGFFHLDIAEVRTGEGKLYLFVAIDRTSKLAFAQLVEKANRTTASAFLPALIEMVPYKIHTVLTDNKEATVRRYHHDSHQQLKQHLKTFLAACNFARRLKTLRGLTPCEYICKCWTETPDRFRLNPLHHTAGLNSWSIFSKSGNRFCVRSQRRARSDQNASRQDDRAHSLTPISLNAL